MNKVGSIKGDILKQSRFLGHDEFIDTGYPLFNLALSGKIDGGLASGLTIFAGPSKHFKSAYMCLCMAAFQRAKPDGLVIFYDSEFGAKESYFESFGVDTERVLHLPLTNLEELKFDVMQRLDDITKEDDVMFATDSFGNLASKKEVDDALSENAAADMTRAKQFKSFGRMITPHLTLKRIPYVGVNHTYGTMELYSQQVMGGGTGLYYSSDTIFFVGRSQNKEGKDLTGFDFTLVADKSRFVKEKSKFPITVSFDGGVDKNSGIFDLILEHSDKVTQKGAWYDYNGKNHRKADLVNDPNFIDTFLKDPTFIKKVESKYSLPVPGGPTIEDLEEIVADD